MAAPTGCFMVPHSTGRPASFRKPVTHLVLKEGHMGGQGARKIREVLDDAYAKAGQPPLFLKAMGIQADKYPGLMDLAAHLCVKEEATHVFLNAVDAHHAKNALKMIGNDDATQERTGMRLMLLANVCDEVIAGIDTGKADFMTGPNGKAFSYAKEDAVKLRQIKAALLEYYLRHVKG